MSFDWEDFLKLAKGLHADPRVPGPFEAAMRSAVSRAYYAAYHCAEELAVQRGFEPTGSAADHKNVQDFFRRFRNGANDPPDRIAREATRIYLQLDRLRKIRNDADYESQLGGLPLMQAETAIGMANRVYASVAQFTSDE